MNQSKYNVKNIYELINKVEGTNDLKESLIRVTVPGSKSITNRALLLAVLATGKTNLDGVLFSDDSRHFMDCVVKLGFDADIDEDNKFITVTGEGGNIPYKDASIYVGSAGTAARFLTALLGISKGTYHLDASAQMRKRPMAPLLNTLQSVGTSVSFEENEGFFPFVLSMNEITSTNFTVNIDTSSQFLSALLISSPIIGKDVVINVTGTHGMAYIDMTIEMMKQFGVNVKVNDGEGDITKVYTITAGQKYNNLDYIIEPDVSAACYFYAMAAILGLKIMVKNVHLECMQGDIQFIHFLEKMGCSVEENDEGVIVTGPKDGKLKGITANMHSCSDQAITMAAIAPFADSPVKITGISHIKFQESDRIWAIVNELTRMGIKVESDEDSVTIYPGQPSPATVNTYDDHRIAMGFAVTGLRSDGIVIDDPGCCRKTFENYFEVLDVVIDNMTRMCGEGNE